MTESFESVVKRVESTISQKCPECGWQEAKKIESELVHVPGGDKSVYYTCLGCGDIRLDVPLSFEELELRRQRREKALSLRRWLERFFLLVSSTAREGKQKTYAECAAWEGRRLLEEGADIPEVVWPKSVSKEWALKMLEDFLRELPEPNLDDPS